jgi:ferredoxin like protein
LTGKADKREEAMHLRSHLSQNPTPSERQALLAGIHDLIDQLPGPLNDRVQTAGSVLARDTDKLSTVHYREDSRRSHIEIADQATCLMCEGKYCNFFCPAGVYRWDTFQEKLLVSFGNCIECGACAIGCPYDNIRCKTPRGGYGVQNKFG